MSEKINEPYSITYTSTLCRHIVCVYLEQTGDKLWAPRRETGSGGADSGSERVDSRVALAAER